MRIRAGKILHLKSIKLFFFALGILLTLQMTGCTKEKKQQADMESAAVIGKAMAEVLKDNSIREEIRPLMTGYVFATARGGEAFSSMVSDEQGAFLDALNQKLEREAPKISYTGDDNGWEPYRWGIAILEDQTCVVCVMDEAALRWTILYPSDDGQYPISVVDKPEEQAPSGPVGDGFWVNFEEIPFYINDKKYVLGVSTLYEMAKDGITVNVAGSSGQGALLSPGEKSERFSVRLNEGWGVNLYAMNTQKVERSAPDCVICEVNLVMDVKEMKDNVLRFNFPLDLTPEKLKAVAGEPSKLEHYEDDKLGYVYDTFIYVDSARKSVGERSYTFKFTDNELMMVELVFRP